MNNIPSANSLSVSVRIYRAMLVAYPKKFREHYETQMVQVFRDSLRDEYHRNGNFGVMDLWLHTFADLVFTALMERLSERSQYMFSPKFILWGGVAGAFGGMFWIISANPTAGPLAIALALILGLGGMAGLYSRQAGEGGKLGLAGFALGIIGTGVVLAFLWWGSTSGLFTMMNRNPALVARPALIMILAFVTLDVGLVLLGVTSLRVKTLHRSRGLPMGLSLLSIIWTMTIWLIVYVPLSQGLRPWDPSIVHRFDVLSSTVTLLLGLGWMGLGIMLATEAEAKVAQPPPASA
jgi:hypothetical protein